MYELMAQVAGVTKLLEQCGHRVVRVRANPQGGQIEINEPLSPLLEEQVDDYSNAGYNLLGVWVTWGAQP